MPTFRRSRPPPSSPSPTSDGKRASASSLRSALYLLVSFLAGFVLCLSHFLHAEIGRAGVRPPPPNVASPHNARGRTAVADHRDGETRSVVARPTTTTTDDVADRGGGRRSFVLSDVSVLVCVVAYDFSQRPHLEEVLDSYRDLCEAGARVDVVLHTTVAFSVPFVDLLNSRLRCTRENAFSLTISVHSPALRLHLVDLHRSLFYDRLETYDLFIYSEDDIRIRPTTVAAYLVETRRVERLLKDSSSSLAKPSDYNVGVVRYEYNFPPDVIINDKTRHATKDVERVYWEHVAKPVWPKAVTSLDDRDPLGSFYVTMGNHHQGAFLATRALLAAWRDRPGCRFHEMRNRPSHPSNPGQPTEGTQRVWASSQMLHGSRHCAVKQILPVDDFGALTVLHVANKNYRRVGKKGRIGGSKPGAPTNEFGDGTETFDMPDASLLTAAQLHKELATRYHKADETTKTYRGVVDMEEKIENGHYKGREEHRATVDKIMRQFNAYKARGGFLIDSDFDD